MMAALRPMGEVALRTKEYPHTEAGLEQMALAILALGEDTWAVMEATGRYHEPVAAALTNNLIPLTDKVFPGGERTVLQPGAGRRKCEMGRFCHDLLALRVYQPGQRSRVHRALPQVVQTEGLPFQPTENGGTVYGQRRSYHHLTQEQQYQAAHHHRSERTGLGQVRTGRSPR